LVDAADDLHGVAFGCAGRFEFAGPLDGATPPIRLFGHVQGRSIARDWKGAFENRVRVGAGAFIARFEPLYQGASAMEVKRSNPAIAAPGLFAPGHSGMPFREIVKPADGLPYRTSGDRQVDR